MPIIYKLVGIKSETINNEMLHPNWDNEKDSINIQYVTKLFVSLGFSDNVSELKFITDSQTMSLDKDYLVTDQESRIIYVFTMSQEFKNILIKIFNEYGYAAKKKVSFDENKEDTVNESTEPIKVDQDLLKPIPEDEIKIDATTISASNLETLRLFEEQDFQTLLNVYVTNPDMFKIFASYVSSGTVVPTVFDKDNSIEYVEQFEEIKKLNIGANDEDITSALSEFNGHINLTLRYLLTVKSSHSA